MVNLIWHEIRSRRTALIGWSIGLIFFGMMYITIYPQMQDQMAGLADLSLYEAMGVEVGTFEGYVASSVIGFIPILLGVYAIMTGTLTLAGEEDNGTLELLVTTRLKRWQIVVAKGIGLLAVTLIIVLIAGVGHAFAFSLIADQITTDVTPFAVFKVVLSTLPLVWMFMLLGLFMGALLPNRRTALMVTLFALIAAYFGENIGGMVDGLDFIRPISPFSYFDSRATAFTEGVKLGDVAVLLIAAAIFFGGAVLSFQRRDVTVGNWPWQRVRLGN